MNKSIVIGILLFGGAFLAGKTFLQNMVKKPSSLYSHLGGDFSLDHVSGKKTLKDFAGRPTVMYFGFATCPDVCPISLSKLNKVLDQIHMSKRSDINKVFVSVDYKRDDAKKVHEYVGFFADDFVGLSGDKKAIEDITKKYAVHFEFVPMKDSRLEYTVDHTSRYFLIDQKGRLLNTYSDIVNDDTFIKDLKRIL